MIRKLCDEYFSVDRKHMKCSEYALIVSGVLWLLMHLSGYSTSFFIGNNPHPIVFGILHFCFLFTIIYRCTCLYSYRNRKIEKINVRISVAYFAIVISIFMAEWPGNYTWDDIWILSEAQHYGLSPWQHFFSGLFHILCLQTIPLCTGEIIIQILVAALVVGYCISQVKVNLLNCKHWIIDVLLFLPTIFPPILSYLYSGYRIGIYSFLELLLITRLVLIYKRKEEISVINCVQLVLLTIIVAAWRSEGIYYVAAVAIIFALFYRKLIRPSRAFICVLIIAIGTIGIGKLNNLMIGNLNYSITATMNPMTAVVRAANESTDKVWLDKINKTVQVQKIREESETSAEDLYWNNELTQEKFTTNDYKEYIDGYVHLLKKYPNAALKIQWNTFLDGSGVVVNDGVSAQRRNVVSDEYLYQDAQGDGLMSIDSPMKLPINMQLRDIMFRIIGCMNLDGTVNPMYYIFWNLWIPIVLGILGLILTVVYKEWEVCIAICVVALRIPLVFVASSAPYVMYYLPAYLSLYFWGIIGIALVFSTKRKRRSKCEGTIH